METKQIAATKENVEIAINNIKKFAEAKGYQIRGEFKKEGILSSIFGSNLKFKSWSQQKVLKNYLWRLDKRVTMDQANKFLHFLYKKVYDLETAPNVDYSEKELKIKAARKAWKKVQAEADRLHAEYRTEKGDFYKK